MFAGDHGGYRQRDAEVDDERNEAGMRLHQAFCGLSGRIVSNSFMSAASRICPAFFMASLRAAPWQPARGVEGFLGARIPIMAFCSAEASGSFHHDINAVASDFRKAG